MRDITVREFIAELEKIENKDAKLLYFNEDDYSRKMQLAHERIADNPEFIEPTLDRIRSMVDYATNDTVCRSRQLLRYFGEHTTTDCGQCDVCLSHEEHPSSLSTEQARERILTLLGDHRRHHISELHALQLPKASLDAALTYLVHEELLHMEGAFLSADS